jgi:hypothetical protein
MNKCSCYKCEDRCIGCHTDCPTYKLYKSNLDKIKEKKKEARLMADYRGSKKRYGR